MRITDLNIIDVWMALGGPRPVGNRSVAFHRGGHGLNIQLRPENGTWKDFARGDSGGILSLIETVLAVDRRAALAWLAENFGVETNKYTLEQRLAYAQRIERARELAAELIGRRDSYLIDLRTASSILLTRYHELIRIADVLRDVDALAKALDVWDLLDALASRRERLKRASGPELADFFRQFDAGSEAA